MPLFKRKSMLCIHHPVFLVWHLRLLIKSRAIDARQSFGENFVGYDT
jgi:hypothetical protein